MLGRAISRLTKPQAPILVQLAGLRMKAKQWVLARHFQGDPADGDVVLQEEELPELNTGDVLLEAQCWSVDPYMRPTTNLMKPGSVMPGQHLGKVVQSKNDKYPLGTLLLANVGWRTHMVLNPDTIPARPYAGLKVATVSPAPELSGLGKTLSLGALGMPGATAYFGFLEICQPKAGETVLVNGAAGAVGSLVGQIAKIKGCRVIGFAGTDEKCKYLKEELGFDYAFNYKKTDVTEALNVAAPNGIDCFFDNVGGEFSTKVIIKHMNLYGRISLCGAIARYNDDPTKLPPGLELYSVILFKQLRIEGFIVNRWFGQFNKAQEEMLPWIKQGKLKFREHVTVGFENMYSAFRGMLKGENTGKAVITASKM